MFLKAVYVLIFLYGVRYLVAAVRTPPGHRFRFSAWDLLFLRDRDEDRGGLVGLAVLCFAVSPGIYCGWLGLEWWRDRTSECVTLLSPDQLAKLSPGVWETSGSGDRAGGTSCYASWQTVEPNYGSVTIQADPFQFDDPDFERRMLERRGLAVETLPYGEWGLIGLPRESAAHEAPEPVRDPEVAAQTAAAVADLIGQPENAAFFAAAALFAGSGELETSYAVISQCGVQIQFSIYGDDATKRARALVDAAAPSFSRLCRYSR